jgi:hypothetical protein
MDRYNDQQIARRQALVDALSQMGQGGPTQADAPPGPYPGYYGGSGGDYTERDLSPPDFGGGQMGTHMGVMKDSGVPRGDMKALRSQTDAVGLEDALMSIYQESPTDSNMELIDRIARMTGVRPPWHRVPRAERRTPPPSVSGYLKPR